MPLTKTIGGGGGVAPQITHTRNAALPDYPAAVGEGYLYDPYYKQWWPEGVMMRAAPIHKLDSTNYDATPTQQNQGLNTMLATDGALINVALCDSDSGSDSLKRLVWSIALPGGTEPQLFVDGDLSISMPGAVTLTNTRFSNPLKVAANTWVWTWGDDTGYKVAKLIYDTGTKTAAVTVSANQRTGITSTTQRYWDLAWDGVDTFFIVIPQNTNVIWDAWSVTNLTRDFNGTFTGASSTRKSSYGGGNRDRTFGLFCPLSDGNFLLIQNITLTAYNWTGAGFSSAASLSLSVGSNPAMQLAPNVFGFYRQGGTQIDWEVVEYDPAGPSISQIVDEQFTDRTGINMNANCAAGVVGEGRFYISNGSSYTLAEYDTATYAFKPETLQTAADNSSNDLTIGTQWDDSGVGYVHDGYFFEAQNNGYIMASVFAAGMFYPNGGPIRVGFLEAINGTDYTVRATVDVVQTQAALTPGTLYDDVIAVDENIALYLNLGGHVLQRFTYVPLTDNDFVTTYAQQGRENLNFNDEFPSGGSLDVPKNRKQIVEFTMFNNDATVSDGLHVMSLDGFAALNISSNKDNADLDWPYYRLSGASVIGLYGLKPENQGTWVGYIQSTQE